MLDKIAINLKGVGILPVGNLLLAGVSGGPDSICLLHVLHRLGYKIIAAHVNHGLRPEAAEEAMVVEQFAGKLGVGFISCQVDVLDYSRTNTVSLEEAARILRYRYLFEQAERLGASAVLVAHNADDQVETILMHLLRGSGLAGLCGMEYRTVPNVWSEDIPLVRPLLSIWRVDILKYLMENEIIANIDESNLNITFFRNRVRHELLPILDSYNPRIRQTLLRTGQSLRDDYKLLQQLANQAWERTLVGQGPGYVAIHLFDFLELPSSTQRYLLRKAIAYHLPGLLNVDFDCIERGLEFLNNGKPKAQTDLIGGLRLIKEKKVFWIATCQASLLGPDIPALAGYIQYTLNIPSTLYLNDDWQLHVEEVAASQSAIQESRANLDPFQAWLDVSEVELPLIVRTRNAGDLIKPLGMDGHSKKISDLMINLKLPSWARASWPLICSGRDILWVPGYRLSHLARIKPNTTRAIHLTLNRGLTT
jgi:tRNA(Ile)-lysidine synthase